MTITTTTSKNTYSGNGSLTIFAYTFRILADDGIKVQVKDANGDIILKTLTTDYTVSGAGDAAGGNVTFLVAPLSTDTVILSRGQALLQGTAYTEAGPLPSISLEDGFDELTMIAQQFDEELDRSVKVDPTISGEWTLPTPVADQYIKYNATADGLETFSLTSGTALGNVVDDTSPQLGGFLDTDGWNILFDDNRGIQDSNDNEMLRFQQVSSAVNYTEITNAATGNSPQVSATGSDANVNLQFRAKGTGKYLFRGSTALPATIVLYEDEDNGSNFMAFASPAAVTASTTLTLPDGDGAANTVLTTNASGILSWSTLTAVAATQAEQETGTNTVAPVTPGRQHYHESAAKVWCSYNTITTTAILDSYNVSSLVDNAQGNTSINWDTDFSSVNYAAVASASTADATAVVYGHSAGAVNVNTYDTAALLVDVAVASVCGFGDQ